MRRCKKKLAFVLFMVFIFCIGFTNVVSANSISEIKNSNAKFKYAGNYYYSVAADATDNEGWITDRELKISSGKFSWSNAIVSAISVNGGPENALQDPNRPLKIENYDAITAGISMVCSFFSGGRSGITNVKLLLQSKGNEHRMLLMYGTPIEQVYAGRNLWLSDILTYAHDGSMAYFLWAKKDADKIVRNCFSGLKKDGQYNMHMTYSKDLKVNPYKYSLVISNDGNIYAYPILHKGTKMEVYYTPLKGKREFAFDATGYIQSEKLEVDKQVKKDVENYIKTNLSKLNPYIKFKASNVVLDILDKTSMTLNVEKNDIIDKISWKSSDTTVVTVNSKGKVYAKKVGTATIFATANGVTAKCKVTIIDPSKISLSKRSISLYEGKTYQLNAAVTGKSKRVTWKSSNTSVAMVSTRGKVTAKKTGTATITATANGKMATCTVKVISPSVKLNKSSMSLYPKATYQLKVTVKGASSYVKWKSSNSSVVYVNSKGKVYAKKTGTATITATANGKTAKCTVTVRDSTSVWKNFLNAGSYKSYMPECDTTQLEYTIYDINKDGIKELLIETINERPFYFTYLFSLDGSKIKMVYKRYGYGQFRYSTKYNVVEVSPETRPFYGTGAYAFYSLKGNKFSYRYTIGEDMGRSFYSDRNGKKYITGEERSKYFAGCIYFDWTKL